jgi:hypothetical protein
VPKASTPIRPPRLQRAPPALTARDAGATRIREAIAVGHASPPNREKRAGLRALDVNVLLVFEAKDLETTFGPRGSRAPRAFSFEVAGFTIKFQGTRMHRACALYRSSRCKRPIDLFSGYQCSSRHAVVCGRYAADDQLLTWICLPGPPRCVFFQPTLLEQVLRSDPGSGSCRTRVVRRTTHVANAAVASTPGPLPVGFSTQPPIALWHDISSSPLSARLPTRYLASLLLQA